MDNSSDYKDLLPNSYNGNNLWGPSAFDSRHVLVINFIYELPFFSNRKALTGKLLGGWQITGVSQFQTGTPFTVSTADDFAGVARGVVQGCGPRSEAITSVTVLAATSTT